MLLDWRRSEWGPGRPPTAQWLLGAQAPEPAVKAWPPDSQAMIPGRGPYPFCDFAFSPVYWEQPSPPPTVMRTLRINTHGTLSSVPRAQQVPHKFQSHSQCVPPGDTFSVHAECVPSPSTWPGAQSTLRKRLSSQQLTAWAAHSCRCSLLRTLRSGPRTALGLPGCVCMTVCVAPCSASTHTQIPAGSTPWGR